MYALDSLPCAWFLFSSRSSCSPCPPGRPGPDPNALNAIVEPRISEHTTNAPIFFIRHLPRAHSRTRAEPWRRQAPRVPEGKGANHRQVRPRRGRPELVEFARLFGIERRYRIDRG